MTAAQKALDALEAAGKSGACPPWDAATLATNLAAPLAAVVRAVADRPWWRRTEDADGEDVWECEGCESQRDDDPDSAHEHDDLLGPCRHAPADAALDAFAVAAQEMFP